jgi:hypothetical protein
LGVIMIRNTAGSLALAATLAASALAQGADAHAAGKYDGLWSVTVYTTSGPCDPAQRFSGQIVNGAISYAYGSLDVTGRVEPSGATSVRVTYGSAHGEAHGHMTLTQGSGTWSGDSPDGRCTGTWSATRPSEASR